MRPAASSSTPAPVPTAPSRLRLVALGVAVVAAHLAFLAWVPAGSPQGRSPEDATLHLVTRMVAAAPPPPVPAKAPAAPRHRAPATKSPPPQQQQQQQQPQQQAAPDADGSVFATPESGDANAAPADPATPPGPAADAGEAAPVVAETTPAPPPPPPPPIGLPASVRLRYDMTGESKNLVYHARAELLWRHDDTRYDARMEVSAFLIGSRVQTSVGRLGPAGLEPERFSDKARTEQATHFDRAGQRVVFSSNAPEVALPAGAQDRLGVFLQLASQLAGEPLRYPPGTTITIPTASTRDLGDWSFVIGSQETLQLPIGTQVAVKAERAPRKDFDTRVEVWFAPALGYLPVRIRITQQGGDFIDQTLVSAERP